MDLSQKILAPVHQHTSWKRLQGAFTTAHRACLALSRDQLCALVAPAAAIATWMLQHAPELGRRERISLLIAGASEFEALDSGRWFQFVPWLMGRPDLKVDVTLAGPKLLNDNALKEGMTAADIERALQSHGAHIVRTRQPARLIQSAALQTSLGEDERFDLCAIFSPAFLLTHDSLMSETGLLPVLAAGTPFAVFSTSDADQLIDAYVLRALGFDLEVVDAWPNPWELPNPRVTTQGSYAQVGWWARLKDVTLKPRADLERLKALDRLLTYAGAEPNYGGIEGILRLGEALRSSDGAVLYRMPRDIAVEASHGLLYQVDSRIAVMLDATSRVPQAVLAEIPDAEEPLERAIWATEVFRRFVEPHLQTIDEALADALNRLDPQRKAA